MKERIEKLLKNLLLEYIKTAEPVASSLLVDKLDEKVSSATIRSELVELEKAGFIYQPHTSAGRVPTEKAYQYFVDNFLVEKKLSAKSLQALAPYLKINKSDREKLKSLAKEFAELTGDAVVLAFAENDIFYTGLSNIFSKPEFEDKNLLIDLSKIIDHLDQVIYDIFDQTTNINIKIGSDCPFGQRCASIFTPLQLADAKLLLAVVGPMRMDYSANYNLIKFIAEKYKS
ncbi:hypothetical protein A2533_01655 [Candidatus Falkowbacteria bacterium RIFOXYD2_FULL_35_9]|uniref:Heat-inducible transcription repressor HrcA C-terminal domain-containing protein n=1 Tax=Candidatus Falkowbacteria bacterium RIFOXYC2_FULL_36_12 TaxID=1798002 RepID=A0A1F5SZ48_9BACT|nr:MAG: hypothetical protein A2300_01975 [Candidatus Falkowbacteria bacterium RIFOXYB2_FULL_35_7]OGF31766.1 MAG: hypothetical protein A2478_04750 [Candidatus Falkowbacteria bacterium RIFOXYC2_FULL_36_12]OGF33106.1 MAG: hypothetical protein A2223_03420 [Candidatus Falkowbacteria bacterium RIFOXYA2_FULL_35_8]OGF48084.1 MAG: hypothetical protein A2533_01655 [Candidatus Falkowbacteria bacterium RIFOXYD2_FULL_35_9]